MHALLFSTALCAPKKWFKAPRVFPTKAEGGGLVASFLAGLWGSLGRAVVGGDGGRKRITHGRPAHTPEEEPVVASCWYPGWRVKARWHRSPDGARAPPQCCCRVCGNHSGAETLLCPTGSACCPAILLSCCPDLSHRARPFRLGKTTWWVQPRLSRALDAAGWLLHSVLWWEKPEQQTEGETSKLINQKMLSPKK